jgi:hypothetical protein
MAVLLSVVYIPEFSLAGNYYYYYYFGCYGN